MSSSWKAWLTCLGVAGAAAWSGCGGGDVPDPESDSRAAKDASPTAPAPAAAPAVAQGGRRSGTGSRTRPGRDGSPGGGRTCAGGRPGRGRGAQVGRLGDGRDARSRQQRGPRGRRRRVRHGKGRRPCRLAEHLGESTPGAGDSFLGLTSPRQLRPGEYARTQHECPARRLQGSVVRFPRQHADADRVEPPGSPPGYPAPGGSSYPSGPGASSPSSPGSAPPPYPGSSTPPPNSSSYPGGTMPPPASGSTPGSAPGTMPPVITAPHLPVRRTREASPRRARGRSPGYPGGGTPPGRAGSSSPRWGLGMPGSSSSGAGAGNARMNSPYRLQIKAVTDFLDAVKAKDPARLKEATALRAPTEARRTTRSSSGPSSKKPWRRTTWTSWPRSSKAFRSPTRTPQHLPGSWGSSSGSPARTALSLQRTITVRKEKAGWKVVDISGEGKDRCHHARDGHGTTRPRTR